MGRSFGASDTTSASSEHTVTASAKLRAGITSGTTSSGRQRVRVLEALRGEELEEPAPCASVELEQRRQASAEIARGVDPPRGVGGAEPPAHRTPPEEHRGDGDGEQTRTRGSP